MRDAGRGFRERERVIACPEVHEVVAEAVEVAEEAGVDFFHAAREQGFEVFGAGLEGGEVRVQFAFAQVGGGGGKAGVLDLRDCVGGGGGGRGGGGGGGGRP